MITINIVGEKHSGGKTVGIFPAYQAHLANVIEGTRGEMIGRTTPLGKFFTKHIKGKLAKGNPQYVSTGRIRQSKNLITIDKSSTKTTKGNTSFFFKYTFPRNFGVEYGYPLGLKETKLRHVDHIAKWIMDKGIFIYTSRGKEVKITKQYQARSVAFIMIKKGEGKQRKFNVTNWYKIDFSDSEVAGELRKYRSLYHFTFINQWNNAKN